MPKADTYWNETSAEGAARIEQQTASKATAMDDSMEFVYSDDLDEIFAELLRLHRIVGQGRTIELLRRTLPERCRAHGL